jgi:hypothetical protein
MPSNRDRVFDGFRQEEVKHCASDKRGCKMWREIVVNEELSTHEEEREIMDEPDDHEKAGRVP